MKKKNVFLAKVFAVALAASMALSTPYASAATVTESKTYDSGSVVSTMDSTWWTGFSEDFYRQSGDFDVTFKISNQSNNAEIWNNYLMVFTTAADVHSADNDAAYKEYYVLRADDFGWGGAGNNNTTVDGNTVTYTHDYPDDDGTYFKDIMKDATGTINVVRKGNDFTIDATFVGANSNQYTRKVTFTCAADKDINIFFTGEGAAVSILSYTVNSGAAPSDDSNAAPAPDTATDSAIDTTPAPDDNAAPAPGTTDDNAAPAPDNSTTTPAPDDSQQDTTPADDSASDDDTDADDEAPAKKSAKLNKTKASVKVGKTVKLKVKNTSKKVTWSSSNKKIAKVNKSGKVTGVKAGKATIKAKVGGKTLKCKVTVK